MQAYRPAPPSLAPDTMAVIDGYANPSMESHRYAPQLPVSEARDFPGPLAILRKQFDELMTLRSQIGSLPRKEPMMYVWHGHALNDL